MTVVLRGEIIFLTRPQWEPTYTGRSQRICLCSREFLCRICLCGSIPTPISWEKAAVDNFPLLHNMMQYAPNLEVAKFPYSSLASRPTEACAFLLWFPNSRHCGLLEQKHYLQLPHSHKTWYMVTYAYTPNKEGQHLPYPMSTSSVSHIYWKGNRPPSSELPPCLPGFLRSKELKWQLKERLKPW